MAQLKTLLKPLFLRLPPLLRLRAELHWRILALRQLPFYAGVFITARRENDTLAPLFLAGLYVRTACRSVWRGEKLREELHATLDDGNYQKSRKAPAFRHGDIRLRVFPKTRYSCLPF